MHPKNGRSEKILQDLLTNGQVDVEELSQKFQVNSSTIRRDLEKLEQQGLLRRTHGGAILADILSYSAYAYDLTFQVNVNKQVEEKALIALAATQYIKPGDTIALSPGTTTTQLARTIRQLQIKDLTVVTNAVNIAMELAGLRGINLIVTGGILLPDFFALVGPQAEQSLNEIFVNQAFIGVTGLHPKHGLTGPNQLEALTHRLTIQRARKTIVLADSTKLGQIALYRIAPTEVIHTLITDRNASPEIIESLKDLGVEVHQS